MINSGAKSSDPTLDNDGNALADGSLYFDTTNNLMKVYDLGNTTWRQLSLTSTNQTNVNTVAGQISPLTIFQHLLVSALTLLQWHGS